MLPEAFADDVNALLKASKDSIDNILTVASDFTKISGLQLSKSKTEIMIIGNDNGLTNHAIGKGLKVVNRIKFVGCWIFPFQSEN